jgi:hypothetical protein
VAPLAALAFSFIGSLLGWVVGQFLRGPATTVGPPGGGPENGRNRGQE